MDSNLLKINTLCDKAIQKMETTYNMSTGESPILQDWKNALFFMRNENGAILKGRYIQWLCQNDDIEKDDLWYELVSSICGDDKELKSTLLSFNVVKADTDVGTIEVSWDEEKLAEEIEESKKIIFNKILRESRALPGGMLDSKEKTEYEDWLEKVHKRTDEARKNEPENWAPSLYGKDCGENGYHDDDGEHIGRTLTKIEKLN